MASADARLGLPHPELAREARLSKDARPRCSATLVDASPQPN
jgi:hypothetical protein